MSYGAAQTLEATARRILGPVDFVVQVDDGPGGDDRTLTLRAEEWRGGERFGDLRGKYYQRVRAQIPADFVQPGTAQTPRPLVAGDEVNVRVIAGSQQQRFSYRVVSTRPAGDAKRVLVVAAEDYTGLSPNKTPYATGAALPRRARRGARGQRLRRSRRTTSTTRPRARTARPGPSSCRTSACCRTSTPSSTTRATTWSRRRSGQGVTTPNYRRGGTVAANGHVQPDRARST